MMSNMSSNQAGGKTVVVVVLLVIMSGAFASLNMASILNTSTITTGPSATYTWPPPTDTDDGNTTSWPLDDSPIMIRGDAEMLSTAAYYGWPGDGTLENPFILQHLGIWSSTDCISIRNVNLHFVIRDCFLHSSGRRALFLEFAEVQYIEHCDLYGYDSGLDLVVCNGTRVEDCRAVATYSGLNACACADVSILSNTVSGCYAGIWGGIHNSTILENIITDNTIGIEMYDIVGSIIASNDILGYDAGILLHYGSSSLIQANRVLNGTSHGLYLDAYTSSIRVLLNFFGFNGAQNAHDDGTSNTWDDGESAGNYWGDYVGYGSYLIPGTAGSIDHYPSILPTTLIEAQIVTGNLWWSLGSVPWQVFVWRCPDESSGLEKLLSADRDLHLGRA